MGIIETITGKESFREGGGHFYATVCNSNAFPNEVEGQWPKTFFGKAPSLTKIGAFQKLHAGRVPMDQLGAFYHAQYEVPDGMVLVFDARRTLRLSGGNELKSACMIAAVARATGPLNRIEYQRVRSQQSNEDISSYVQGRFDLVTLRDILRLGADPCRGKMNLVPLFSNTRRSGLLNVREMQPEIQPAARRVERQVPDASSGGTTTVTSSEQPRMVDLD